MEKSWLSLYITISVPIYYYISRIMQNKYIRVSWVFLLKKKSMRQLMRNTEEQELPPLNSTWSRRKKIDYLKFSAKFAFDNIQEKKRKNLKKLDSQGGIDYLILFKKKKNYPSPKFSTLVTAIKFIWFNNQNQPTMRISIQLFHFKRNSNLISFKLVPPS